MGDLSIQPGDVFVGRLCNIGLQVEVISYEPENDHHYGMADVRIKSSFAQIDRARSNLAYAELHGSATRIANAHAALTTALGERVETRELRWFTESIKHGRLERVVAGHG